MYVITAGVLRTVFGNIIDILPHKTTLTRNRAKWNDGLRSPVFPIIP